MDTHPTESPLDRRLLLGAAGLAGIAALASGRAKAGPLNPPAGAVGSTGKTLTEVEPRTAVNAVNTPGDASYLYRIAQPGSYYLTGNIQGVAGKGGILIDAPGVTLDLNGFDLAGPGGTGFRAGITNSSAAGGSAILNGCVRNWPGDGLTLTSAHNNIVNRVRAIGNGDIGIFTSLNAVITECVACNNGSVGIASTRGGTISQCIANANGNAGFSINSGGTLIGCTAIENLGNGASLTHNNFMANCCISGNDGHGIQLYSDNIVRANTCVGNGAAGAGRAAIASYGYRSRIEENHCTGSEIGILVSVTDNFIARNTCTSNDVNWDVDAGNVCIVVAAALTAARFTGNAGGLSAGTTNPLANYTV